MPVVLPKYVVFKGVAYPRYLKRYHNWEHQHLQFSTDDRGDVFAAMEIIPAANGNIHIKCVENKSFWSVGKNEYVYVDSTDTSSSATLFRPIQLDDQTIVLQNVGNNKFCKRYSEGPHKPDLLRAYLPIVDKHSKLKVEEPVLNREIYDIKYDVDNAKIYGDTVVAVGEDFLTNDTDQPASMHLEIIYEDIKIATWKSSLSLKTNVTATAEAGVPLVAEGKVEVSLEMQAGIEWGKTETKKTTKTSGVTTTVPPKSKAKITLVAERGSCDVPFTYKQKDTLYDGSTVIYEYSGIFTGTNYYGTYFEIPEFEPLSPKNRTENEKQMAVVLPKFVVFKGDNDMYLRHYYNWGKDHLQFSTDEIGDVCAAMEIVPVANGNIRIKCVENKCFWKVGENEFVYVDSPDTSSNDSATLFRPIKLDDHTIVLQNVGNNKFCKRYSDTESRPSLFRAYLPNVDKFSKLRVEEPVLSREIYDIEYDVGNAKRYGDTVVSVGEDFLTNHSDVPSPMHMEIKYEDIKIATWNASFSVKTNVTATARAGFPLVEEVDIQVSTEMQVGIEWGKTEKKRTEKTAGVTTTVPPKSKGKIHLVAKQGSCDVPFTYKQRDTLYDGSTVIHEYSGIFTGTNYYGTFFEIPKFEPL